MNENIAIPPLTEPQHKELMRRFAFAITSRLVPISLRRGRTVVIHNLIDKGMLNTDYRMTELGWEYSRRVIYDRYACTKPRSR